VITLFLVIGVALSFSAGCILGNNNPPRTGEGLEVVEEVWDIIFQDYVEKDRLDAAQLRQAAIKGMVEALDDPYTSYLTPETYQMSLTGLAGRFEGIGAFVGVRDGQLIIVAPIPDSPAAKAGIRAGDVILEIDGAPATEMSLQEAVLHIRGPKGTAVRLLILHQDEVEPEEVEIVRDEIEVPSVRSEMREEIGYIGISQFSERTDAELIAALEDVTREGATGIILDLRSNPGGLLEVVVDVASHFLKEGTVVSVVNNQGKQASLSVESKSVTTDLPIVVLTDNFSASGSEVLAGALQDHGRAIIAGTKTYGKGSVNALHQLQDGSGLYITTSRWLTPNERLIEGEGISPDYKLELEGEEIIQWAIDYLRSNQ